jgi:hypothetical protein
MAAPKRLVAVAIAAGLSLAALAGCGSPANTPASLAARPAKPAKPAKVPMTTAFVSTNMSITAGAATSVHVDGFYVWPGVRLTVNIGQQVSGPLAGVMTEFGITTSFIGTGGRLYARYDMSVSAIPCFSSTRASSSWPSASGTTCPSRSPAPRRHHRHLCARILMIVTEIPQESR